MRSIQKVVIHRAEGPLHDSTMREVTFTGDTAEETGNWWLRLIAKTAPDGQHLGTCDKTDVWVTFSNGQTGKFQFEVQHYSLPDNDTDIRSHLRAHFLYLSQPEALPHLARDPQRLAAVRRLLRPEDKTFAEPLLALLDADNVKGVSA